MSFDHSGGDPSREQLRRESANRIDVLSTGGERRRMRAPTRLLILLADQHFVDVLQVKDSFLRYTQAM